MRLIFKTSKSTEIVPFNNQTYLNGAINKWLGHNNKWHNVPGNYNISSLLGGKKVSNGLSFPNGAKIVVSFLDNEFIAALVDGMKKDPLINWGMRVDEEFEIELDSKIYGGKNFFFALSPILIKKTKEGERDIFLTYESENVNEVLTDSMANKLRCIYPDVELFGFKIEFARDYGKTKKIKKVLIKNVINTASICPIIIYGKKETVELCYNLGIGRSVNSGFGCISKNKIW